MSYWKPNRPETADDSAGAPTACPSCRSTSIVAVDKKQDKSVYWRCEPCGEVWSPLRRTAPRNVADRWR